MATEFITNQGVTRSSAGISASATSITVNNFSKFPTSNPFRIFLGQFDIATATSDGEICFVTAGAGTGTWTITRAQEGTTAQAWPAGTLVSLSLTRQMYFNLTGDYFQTGTVAALPANEQSGHLYFPNNGFYIYRDTGSAWVPWGPVFPMTEPVNGDFSWVNQGAATISTTNGGVYLENQTAVADNINGRFKSAPTPPYTISAACLPRLFNANFASLAGLAFRESSTGKITVFQVRPDNGDFNYSIANFTNATTFSAVVVNTTAINAYNGTPVFIRIGDDNTNLTFSFSKDGINYHQVHSVGRTSFMAGAPDEVGFEVQAATQSTGINILSWEEA